MLKRLLFNLHLAEAQSQCILGNELVSNIMCIECVELNIQYTVYLCIRNVGPSVYVHVHNLLIKVLLLFLFLFPFVCLPPCIFYFHLLQKQCLSKSINGVVLFL